MVLKKVGWLVSWWVELKVCTLVATQAAKLVKQMVEMKEGWKVLMKAA